MARELLRAAVAGEPQALARLRAVSVRPILAAAQLAIAREHGFRSWPALRTAAEGRRRPADWQLRAGAGRPEAQDIALGRWSWTYSTDGQRKRDVMTVFAEDDLGGLYISNFGGGRGRPGYEEVKLTFRPRLAPRASLLTLTFTSQTQQVTAEIPLTL